MQKIKEEIYEKISYHRLCRVYRFQLRALYAQEVPEILLVNLDKLTYAGNLENLKDVEGDPRHVFVQGDICDKELVESLFAKYDFDYVINFAAESHVDRSIKNPEIFVQSNVMGTVNLLQRWPWRRSRGCGGRAGWSP